MKSINTAVRFITLRLGIASSVAVEDARIAGRDANPSTRSRLARWVAVLTLAIALAPGAASAQEDDTVTISGLFHVDYLGGGELDLYYFDPDLLAVYHHGYEHGYEHTWKLTLHGTTQSHYSNGSYYGTDIHATSFHLEFFGPDAATINGLVSEHLSGQDVYAYLQNTYYDNGGGLAIMHIGVGHTLSGNLFFYSGHDIGVDTLFPADADGYPVVGLEPFSIEPDYTELGVSDLLSATGGAIGSLAGPATFVRMADAPSLTITRSNDAVMVSWPSPSTGFSLQQNDQLGTTNWVTPTETVTNTGVIKFITVDPPMGSRSYRLFKP